VSYFPVIGFVDWSTPSPTFVPADVLPALLRDQVPPPPVLVEPEDIAGRLPAAVQGMSREELLDLVGLLYPLKLSCGRCGKWQSIDLGDDPGAVLRGLRLTFVNYLRAGQRERYEADPQVVEAKRRAQAIEVEQEADRRRHAAKMRALTEDAARKFLQLKAAGLSAAQARDEVSRGHPGVAGPRSGPRSQGRSPRGASYPRRLVRVQQPCRGSGMRVNARR
jgi:hypothetical protein